MCQAKDNAYDQAFLSFSADGHVCCWELDAEQNCDVFRHVVSRTLPVLPNLSCTLAACITNTLQELAAMLNGFGSMSHSSSDYQWPRR